MTHNPDRSPTPRSLVLLRDILSELQSSRPDDEQATGLMSELLSQEDYVDTASHITNSGDAEHLLGFILRLVSEGSSNSGTTLETNRRAGARRLMLKIAAKIPVIPRSLSITGVTVTAIDDLIGWGGFGVVFKGEFCGMIVALKVLNKSAHHYSLDFCREALTWRSLEHKFVLPLIGIYQDRSTSWLYLVSPYMPNGTLAQWRKNGPSSYQIENRLLEVAQGLQYIHSEGVIHGDLQGKNILLDANFRVQIADFGLTRHSEATISNSGAMHCNFAAPELFGDFDAEDDVSDNGQSRARTQKSDIYAFGCLYYEIHYDMVPFMGKGEGQIMLSLSRGNRPPCPELPPLREEGRKLMQDCWMQDKEARPAIEDVVKSMLAWQSARSNRLQADFCTVCGSSFSTRHSFKNHMKVHEDNRPFKCKYTDRGCTYCTAAPSTMMRHSKTCKFQDVMSISVPQDSLVSGTLESQNRSPDIGQSARSNLRLNSYIAPEALQEASLGRRMKRGKYFCTVCGSSFSTWHILENHMKAHEDNRPFKCKYTDRGCTYCTAVPSTMMRHSKTCKFQDVMSVSVPQDSLVSGTLESQNRSPDIDSSLAVSDHYPEYGSYEDPNHPMQLILDDFMSNMDTSIYDLDYHFPPPPATGP